MKMMKSGVNRIERYAIRLFSHKFNVIVHHVSGAQNGADFLSRNTHIKVNQQELERDMKKTNPKVAYRITTPFPTNSIITKEDIIHALDTTPDLVQPLPQTAHLETKITQPAIKNQQDNRNLENQTTQDLESSNTPKYSVATLTVETKETKARIRVVHSKLINELAPMLTHEQIIKEQKTDTTTRAIREQMMKAGALDDWYYVYQGCLYRKTNKEDPITQRGRIFLPKNLIGPALAYQHLENHCGSNVLLMQLKGEYFFPRMNAACKEFCRACVLCSTSKYSNNSKMKIDENTIHPVLRKNSVFSLDICQGFPKHRNFTGSFLTIQDLHTNFRILTPLAHETANEVATILEERLISIWGAPELLISDGGTNLLRSQAVQNLCTRYNVRTHITTANAPQTHGTIERSQLTICNLLRTLETQVDLPFPKLLSMTQLALNSTPTVTLAGNSPLYMMTGINPADRKNTHLQLKDFPDVEEAQHNWMEHQKKCEKIVRDYANERTRLNKKKRGKQWDLKKGDFVFPKDFAKREKRKSKPIYLQPLMVVKIFPKNTVLCQSFDGKTKVHHLNNLKAMHFVESEMFNNLPFRVKEKLGMTYTKQELELYMENHTIPNRFKPAIPTVPPPPTRKATPTADLLNNDEPRDASPTPRPKGTKADPPTRRNIVLDTNDDIPIPVDRQGMALRPRPKRKVQFDL